MDDKMVGEEYSVKDGDILHKVKENKERRMKEKQDRLREQQNKKDAEFQARQLILKVSFLLFCFWLW